MLKFKKGIITSEFARVPRTTEEMGRWKGTELRQFHRHTGPEVLKGILNTSCYKHFLNFYVATKLLEIEYFVGNAEIRR